MSQEEIRTFVERWEAVNARERDELRASSPEARLRHLAALMASVDAFGWREALSDGEDDVRQRWRRLREAYGV